VFADPAEEARRRLDRATDAIRRRFGRDAVRRGFGTTSRPLFDDDAP